MEELKKSDIKLNPKQRHLVSARVRYTRKKYREDNKKLGPVINLVDAMKVYYAYIEGRNWHQDEIFMGLLRQEGPIEIKK